jgi:hypothetical protein
MGVEREIVFDASPEAGEILAHDGAEGLDFESVYRKIYIN